MRAERPTQSLIRCSSVRHHTRHPQCLHGHSLTHPWSQFLPPPVGRSSSQSLRPPHRMPRPTPVWLICMLVNLSMSSEPSINDEVLAADNALTDESSHSLTQPVMGLNSKERVPCGVTAAPHTGFLPRPLLLTGALRVECVVRCVCRRVLSPRLS